MAENKEGQEKTENATAKRQQESRMRGQVAKSQDVTTAAVMLIGGLVVFVLGKQLVEGIKELMRFMLRNSSTIHLTEHNIGSFYIGIVVFLAKVLLPIMLVIFAIVFITEVSQVGLKIATKKFTEGLQFKQMLNPFSGLKKIFFSSRSVFELVKSLAKIFILGIVVYWVLRKEDKEIIALIDMPFIEIASYMVKISLELVYKVGLVYIIIAFADLLYQRYKFKEDLKMTKQEVKEESRQSEGDPKIKARLRSIMRNRIRKLMLRNVKTADVLITNPTHFAIALAYKQGEMSAPKCVAKGLDYLALQLIELANDANVTIVEEPPLARALYFSVEVEQEIPEQLFKAVAQVLAYVYKLKRKAA